MQKDLKGGYQLISLGMTPIEDIEYIDAELLKTTKRIVLTGISLDGVTQLPDKTVDIEYDDTDVTFKNVYGYDITVDTVDNSVLVSETQSSGGGSQLYKHTFDLKDDNDVIWKFTLIDNNSADVALVGLYTRLSDSLSAWCHQDGDTDKYYKVTSYDYDTPVINIDGGTIPMPNVLTNSTTVEL